MQNENQAKAIIEKHIDAMTDELGTSDYPIGLVGNNAVQIITEIVFNTMMYGADVESYMEKENMLKD